MADHIRGRLRADHQIASSSGRKWVYVFEVVDTHRGVVLHRDNSCGWANCLTSLRRNVGLCREAWHMGVLAKRTWCS